MAKPERELMQALHEEHAQALWSYALHLTYGDRRQAEDVVQETLLRAWRHPKVLDQTNGSARAWLFTVARRIVIDAQRAARSRSEVATDAVPERQVPDGTDEALQQWLVADALAELSARHREVVVLCFYYGHSVAEAAAQLDIPAGTVKSRTHYALRALRLTLEERGVSE